MQFLDNLFHGHTLEVLLSGVGVAVGGWLLRRLFGRREKAAGNVSLSGKASVGGPVVATRDQSGGNVQVAQQIVNVNAQPAPPTAPAPALRADDIYWLLTVIRRRDLRKAMLDRNIDGAMVPTTWWIGDIAVHDRHSRWFYDLVNRAGVEGLLFKVEWDAPGVSYILSEDAKQILEAGRRAGRAVGTPPGPLVNAQTGEAFDPLAPSVDA